jgi:hypothetical protein
LLDLRVGLGLVWIPWTLKALILELTLWNCSSPWADGTKSGGNEGFEEEGKGGKVVNWGCEEGEVEVVVAAADVVEDEGEAEEVAFVEGWFDTIEFEVPADEGGEEEEEFIDEEEDEGPRLVSKDVSCFLEADRFDPLGFFWVEGGGDEDFGAWPDWLIWMAGLENELALLAIFEGAALALALALAPALEGEEKVDLVVITLFGFRKGSSLVVAEFRELGVGLFGAEFEFEFDVMLFGFEDVLRFWFELDFGIELISEFEFDLEIEVVVPAVDEDEMNLEFPGVVGIVNVKSELKLFDISYSV